MGSKYQFEAMSEAQARQFLVDHKDNHQSDLYPDKLRAQRALVPVASAQEIENNKAFMEKREPVNVANGGSVANVAPAVAELRAKIKPKGPWFTVPAGESDAQCRSCRATVFWIRTEKGERMQVDCDVDGGTRPTRADDGKGVAHFATCPQADQWRKK